MSETNWQPVPKWPFFLGDAAMAGMAYFIYFQTRTPIGHWEFAACALCVALGAALGVWPFLLDHRQRVKQIDRAALLSVTERLQNLEQVSAQISAATHDWQTVQLQAEKTSNASKEIAERMAAEARDFAGFMQKANDSEKATLRLEVEKLRRAEMDWLQVLVHVLDHVHALHGAAVRAGQTRVIEQLTQFRNVCHDAVRRVGLVAYAPAPGEAFDAQKHQLSEGEIAPAGVVVGEVLAAGFTYQGRLVRPALVRIAVEHPPENPPSEQATAASAAGQFTLERQTPD